MLRHVLFSPVILIAWIGIPASVQAASHADNTVIPIGHATIKQGRHDVVYVLPHTPMGLIDQPVVLIAAQPWVVSAHPNDDSSPHESPTTPTQAGPRDQVPTTLKIMIADQSLPDWRLRAQRSMYVINLDALRKNPEYAHGKIKISIDLQSQADELSLLILSMPDPVLLGDGHPATLNGPLSRFIEAATDPTVKAYFQALAINVAGKQSEAQAAYQALASSHNQQVARSARRGLRLLSYQTRRHKLSGNFMEHYRWGLYLQFCGLFDAAYSEFEECRILDPSHEDSQFHSAECLNRIGGTLMQWIYHLDRASEAAKVSDPTIWYVLVTILRTRGGVTLSQTQIDHIKDSWMMVEKMVWASTRGVVKMATVFDVLDQDRRQDYRNHLDRVLGPADDYIETRGWFDSLISVRPRMKNEDRTQVDTGGGHTGPNGTAIAALYHDAGWPQYLQAIYSHLAWAAHISEADHGIPSVEDALDCGPQPAPSRGFAYRSALHYHFSRQAFYRLDISEVEIPESYIQLWKIEGPYRVNSKGQASKHPTRHVMDPLPPGTPAKTVHLVSDEPFIDLAKLFPNAGWARASATSWVYSPEDQSVLLRLGQNDGVAVWLNGQCLHEGRYYSAGKITDRNLVDTIITVADLKRGWNELRVVTESWPKPHDKGWGFSVSMTSKTDHPIPGLACVYNRPKTDLVPRVQPPTTGKHYSWAKVGDDFRRRLPRLVDSDLVKITDLHGLKIISHAQPFRGFVAIHVPDRTPTPTYRPPPANWKDDQDRDVVLNNVMDWAREATAVIAYQQDGQTRDLLFLKPEAIEPYLLLLNEPDRAKAVFKGSSTSDRILGYVEVPIGASTRTLLVVDTLLGDAGSWPADEEDLLTPIGEYVPNDVDQPVTGPQAPASNNSN